MVEFELNSVEYDVVFWLFMLFNLIAFAIVRVKRERYFSLLFNSATQNRQLVQNVQEEFKQNNLSSILLTATYFTSLSALMSFFLSKSFNEFAAILLVLLIALFLIKGLAMFSLVFVAQSRSGIYEHFYNHLVFYQIGGVVMTIVLIFIHFIPLDYQNIASITLVSFVLLLLFLRELLSLFRALKGRVPPLYIILYLCTLELLPAVLLAHLLVNNLQGF